MRAPGSSSARARLMAGVLGAAICFGSYADVGGGRPSTPYRLNNPTAKQVSEARDRASRYQSICLPAGMVPGDRLDAFALVYLPEPPGSGQELRIDEDWLQARAFYELRGEQARKPAAKVRLSEIESVTVIDVADGEMLLEVTKWPDISPAELIELQPSYAALKAAYRSKLELRVRLVTSSGERLALYSSYARRPVFLDGLQRGAQLQFYCGDPTNVDNRRFWWAVPSVASDPEYPYRTVFKAGRSTPAPGPNGPALVRVKGVP